MMSTFRQYKSEINEHTLSVAHLHETVSNDVADYLARGGQITVVPNGLGKGITEFIDKLGKSAKGGKAKARSKRGESYRAESYRRIRAKLNERAKAKGRTGHATPHTPHP